MICITRTNTSSGCCYKAVARRYPVEQVKYRVVEEQVAQLDSLTLLYTYIDMNVLSIIDYTIL